MATKCVTITNEAYERLASFKEGKESFSDVINKLTKGHSLLDIVGILSHKEANELRSFVKERNNKFRESIESTSRKLA